MNLRLRGDDEAAVKSQIKNCVFVGKATGLTRGLLWSNTDDGSGLWDGYPIILKDSVVMNYTSPATAIGELFTVNQKTKFNTVSIADKLCFYNNNINVVSGLTVSNILTINPQLASSGYLSSMNQEDYCVMATELIGSASDGGNIGFTNSDI